MATLTKTPKIKLNGKKQEDLSPEIARIKEHILHETYEMEREIERYRAFQSGIAKEMRDLFWPKSLVFVLAVLMTLSLFEAILRTYPFRPAAQAHGQQDFLARFGNEIPRDLFKIDQNAGWTLAPGFRGEVRGNEYLASVRVSAQGIRDREYGVKRPGTLRVMGLGDEAAFGWGVENQESFLKVIERRLNAGPDIRLPRISVPVTNRAAVKEGGVQPGTEQVVNRTEVVNAAVPGYGTYEELNWLKAYGLAYKPDLVLVAFNEANDFRQNGDSPEITVIADGYLKNTAVRVPGKFEKSLLRRSAFASLINLQLEDIYERAAYFSRIRKTQEYLLEMRETLAAEGIPLMLVVIPEKGVASSTLRRLSEGLQDFCQINDISYLRLNSQFDSGKWVGNLRFEDSQLNPVGHALAAEEISDFIEANDFGKKVKKNNGSGDVSKKCMSFHLWPFI